MLGWACVDRQIATEVEDINKVLTVLACQLSLQLPFNFSFMEKHPTIPGGVLRCRGLRLKIGVDWGLAMMRANPVTGRLDYLGRPLNRAARFVDKAKPGTVRFLR